MPPPPAVGAVPNRPPTKNPYGSTFWASLAGLAGISLGVLLPWANFSALFIISGNDYAIPELVSVKLMALAGVSVASVLVIAIQRNNATVVSALTAGVGALAFVASVGILLLIQEFDGNPELAFASVTAGSGVAILAMSGIFTAICGIGGLVNAANSATN